MKLIFFSLLFVSCASKQLVQQRELRSLYQTQSYEQALSYLEKKKSDKPRRKLLYFLEKATLYHTQGQYQQAAQTFQQAKELSDELYTQKLSQKAATFVLSDQVEDYYGAHFERSLVFYYQALDFLLLYQQEKHTQYLQQARAAVLAWDSYLKAQKFLDKSRFRDDLLLRMMGALVYQQFDSSSATQTAQLLHQEAENVLDKSYNIYPTYNQKWKDFSSKKPVVEPTHWQRSLKEFFGSQHKNDNVFVIVETGLVPQKYKGSLKLGLESALNLIKDQQVREIVKAIGIVTLTLFASQELGLFQQGFSAGDYWSFRLVEAGVYGLGIELPIARVDYSPPQEKYVLQVETQQGKLMKKEPLLLAGPVGQLAQESVLLDSKKKFLKNSVKALSKQIISLVSAYKTYQYLRKQGTKKSNARALALVEYFAAQALMKSLSRPDLRQWVGLPQEIFMTSFQLPTGHYRLQLQDLKAQEIEVKQGEKTFVYQKYPGYLAL